MISLRPYQEIALDHCAAHPRCALWMPMGLGKTLTSLAFVDALAAVEGEGETLVMAPKRVAVDTWPAEAERWGLGPVAPITGTAAQRAAALRSDAPIKAINYENIPWLVETLDGKVPFRTIISDESTRLKGFRLRAGGLRAAALARIAHAPRVQHFIELSGTPAANGLIDLWGQLWFVDQGARLGRTYTAFVERWFRTGYNGYGYEPLPHAMDEIMARCADVCLSIDAADWFDLEEPIVNTVYADLPSSARATYAKLERDMFVALEQGGSASAVNSAAKSSKCLQLANGAVYLDPDADSDDHPKSKKWAEVHDAKLQALDSIIAE